MYSVSLAVFDKANNYKVTRCLVFYDDKSKVEMNPKERTLVKQSSQSTNYTWVSVNSPTLNVVWTDKFINYRHKNNFWLASVGKVKDVESEYDDHVGKRTVDAIPNAHGKMIYICYK